MRRIKAYILLTCLWMVSAVAFAQVEVTATLDSSSIKMGQQTILHFSVTQPQNLSVRFPVFDENLTDDIFIVDMKGDTVVNGTNITVKNDIVITAFQPGTYKIPSLTCMDENKKEYKTNELSLNVLDVKTQFEEGHIPEDIKNIYDPTFSKIIWIILISSSLILIAICVLAFILWKHHKEDPEPYVYNDAVATSAQPVLTALELIRKLGEEKMWQTPGNEKKFFTMLTDVLRQYFYRRYRINAMEMTSSELVEALRKQDVPYMVREKVQQICFTGDMTKFAKHKPTDDECMKCVTTAEEVVKITAPAEEENKPNAPENGVNEVNQSQEK